MFDLFSDFFDNFDIYPVYREEMKCPDCNMTYSMLQKNGRFGCAKCCEVFKGAIERTVKQIHQNTEHRGKVPSRCAGELKRKRRYEELKKEIATAVSNEDYEKAAILHKDLKEMGGDKI